MSSIRIAWEPRSMERLPGTRENPCVELRQGYKDGLARRKTGCGK